VFCHDSQFELWVTSCILICVVSNQNQVTGGRNVRLIMCCQDSCIDLHTGFTMLAAMNKVMDYVLSVIHKRQISNNKEEIMEVESIVWASTCSSSCVEEWNWPIVWV